MASTTFVDQSTVIVAAWLNDVNTATYTTVPANTAAIATKAAAGANTDITSLGGLTTTLSIAQGGTAATSASAARTSLGVAASGLATASGLTQSTNKLLGRSTASTGAIEELTIGTGLTLAAGILSADAAVPGAGSITPAMLAQPPTLGTAQATTSGTSIDFTVIPSWAKKITIMFDNVSTSALSNWLVQGGSGSIETTSYASGATYSATGSAGATSTAGFIIAWASLASSAATLSGHMTLTHLGSNVWIESHTLAATGSSASFSGGGRKAFAGPIDRLRFTTVNGTDTFDAGSWNILYE